LASRHHSLDLSELMDVTDLLEGFETHNSVVITTAFGYDHGSRTPGLVVDVMAWETQVVEGVPVPLASVRLHTSSMNQKTLKGVLTHALYALDFKLAQREFDSVATKKA